VVGGRSSSVGEEKIFGQDALGRQAADTVKVSRPTAKNFTRSGCIEPSEP
jgi:hypothetical protein